MSDYQTSVLIIGSGPSGYTAGIYAARAGLKPLIFTGPQTGGQLTLTTEIENFPGFPEPISGPELMNRMRQQAENVGVQIIEDKITKVDLNAHPFICQSENGHHISADSIIISTGATARWLGLESESKFLGFGVSGCATCDGFFYRNKDVAVIGGGNTAVDEALYLTNFARSVTLIHRRDALRADQTLQTRLFNNPKITVEWDSVVDEFVGTDTPKSLTGLKVKNVKTGNIKEIKVDGAFVAIGHHPNSELFKEWLDIDAEGYLITPPNSCKTKIDGVFAAGDVQDPHFRQAIVAAGSGCIAALEAEKYLNELKNK